MSGFGAGLGSIVGSSLAATDLTAGQNSVNNIAGGFGGVVAPDVQFGQSFLGPATGAINNISATAGKDPNLNYNTFMNNYQTSPGAQYQIGVADAAQNNSAAARGQLLSGANERALSTINQGIANTYANQAYTNYLQGNQQQFGQLQSALGDMFSAIGVGTTATGQQAGVTGQQLGATSQLAQAQAKNDQSKGSGIGSIFGGLSAIPFSF
ncbi:MAG: hypothetical protein AAGL98_00610 [Planctomycetota bacterium]